MAQPFTQPESMNPDRKLRTVDVSVRSENIKRELIKEVEVIQGVMALLQRTLEKITEQIRLSQSAKYSLEKDLKDKFQALKIDNHCSTFTNNTPAIGYASNVVTVQSSVNPVEWEDLSNTNIVKAEKQKNSSVALRTLIESILSETASDMLKQCDTVNVALEKRVAETKDAKNKLEVNLAKVMDEITSQEKNIENLKKAIADKESPIKVAQTRLETRGPDSQRVTPGYHQIRQHQDSNTPLYASDYQYGTPGVTPLLSL
ncbi:tektin-1-like [Rana temporaria]|uniref:tektin-1-like n=1 Tax=Rana temporaria TaxID=8407 RepID=UPI001AADC4AB|nr:tektin-1-like [Rana temporaria]